MIDNYNDWYRVSQVEPPNTERILVSDGDIQVIAQMVDSNTWLFDNPSLKDVNITWWKPLPKDPPIVKNT